MHGVTWGWMHTHAILLRPPFPPALVKGSGPNQRVSTWLRLHSLLPPPEAGPHPPLEGDAPSRVVPKRTLSLLQLRIHKVHKTPEYLDFR